MIVGHKSAGVCTNLLKMNMFINSDFDHKSKQDYDVL